MNDLCTYSLSPGMLDEVCSHDHLLQMSSWKGDWKGIIKRGQDATDNQHHRGSEQQMEKVLMKWKEQEGSGATYQKLIDTLKELGNLDAANRVHSLATTGTLCGISDDCNCNW